MNITVTNHKGGVGKTVTAVHLAAFLALEFGEGSTTLVDTDPNEGALEWASRGQEGEQPLPFEVAGPGQDIEDAEHVVIDSQGRLFGEDLEAAAQMSDMLVVPTTIDGLALDTLMRFIEDVEEIGGGAEYRVLLTRVPHNMSLRLVRARRALERLEVPLFKAQVRDRVAFQDAAVFGVPVYAVREKRAAQGWEDYKRVGREVIGDR